jgi:hypothetical protein
MDNYPDTGGSQGQEDWLAAHVRTFAFIGGVPAKLVPDNLKSGVTDACYYDPVLNRSYHELARHYEIAVVPARVLGAAPAGAQEGRCVPDRDGGDGLLQGRPRRQPRAQHGQGSPHQVPTVRSDASGITSWRRLSFNQPPSVDSALPHRCKNPVA